MNTGPEPPSLTVTRCFALALRAALFRPPKAWEWTATPLVVAKVFLATLLLTIGLERLMVGGPAVFNPEAFMWGWGPAMASLWLFWVLAGKASAAGRPVQVAALFTVGLALASLFDVLLAGGYLAMLALGGADGSTLHWWLYGGFTGWAVLAFWALYARVVQPSPSAIALVGLFALGTAALSHYSEAPWYWYPLDTGEAGRTPRFVFTQEMIEAQLQAAERQRAGLLPQRPGLPDLFAITYAPFDDEDVFLKESGMVGALLEARFDARGHIQQLVNHPSTHERLPWATPLNLQRAIARAAQLMDRDEDVMLIYLTSHGGRDQRLATSLRPLTLEELTPAMLARWLDQAGVRHRVIVISACYSGGWVDALKSDDTLVMTAAARERTSYGCGSGSDLTFFGRAVFDEELRAGHSFEEAFRAALPVIRRREAEAGKDDGFSDPQLFVGPGIRAKLAELERHLAGGAVLAPPGVLPETPRHSGDQQGPEVVHVGAGRTGEQ